MVRVVARILAFFAALLGLFMVAGIVLPGEWSAEATRSIDAPPEAIFPLVNSASGWQEWTPWPETGAYTDGPDSGMGSVRGWDDPNYGDGRFEIVESIPPTRVSYTVDVEGGRIHILGWVILDRVGDGTRITWREDGDFGRNPLLGYAARSMPESQGAQMRQNLERLAELVEGAGTAGSGSDPEIRPEEDGAPGASAPPSS